jgi:hypothetical protein
MGGCGNPQLIRDILDCCNWLMHMPGYPLKGSMEAIHVEIEKTSDGNTVPLMTHHDAVVFFPTPLMPTKADSLQAQAEVTFRLKFRPGTLRLKKLFWKNLSLI